MSLGRVTLGEAAGNLLQQLVAGAVAEAVVDLLEAVEVDEQHREHLLGPRRAGERLVEPVAEERAVRKPGEAVVERLTRQLLLEPNPLGDVACVEHDAADVAVVAKVGDMGLEVSPFAEPVVHPEQDLVGLSVAEGRLHERAIVWMDEAQEAIDRARLPPSRPSMLSTDWLA